MFTHSFICSYFGYYEFINKVLWKICVPILPKYFFFSYKNFSQITWQYMFNPLRLKSIYLLLFFHVLSVVLFLPSALIDINWLFILPYTTFVDWLAMSLVILVTKYKLIFIVQVYSTCWRFMVHTFAFSNLQVILYNFLYSIKAL